MLRLKHSLLAPFVIAMMLAKKGYRTQSNYLYVSGDYRIGDNQKEGDLFDNRIFSSQKPNDWVFAPYYQQVIDWLREEHGIEVTQNPSIRVEKGWYQFDITRDNPHHEDFASAKDYYKAYDKAIKKAIKLVKNVPRK